MKRFELACMDGRKSFYGKARVEEYPDGRRLLISYDTAVCEITAAGEFVRLWDGYSATTMRHINAFIQFYGLNGGGAAWWKGLPVADGGKADTGGRVLSNEESYRAMIGRRTAKAAF